jgi:hypothetical protein
METRPRNPFDSLYVTETIDPASFVSVFSPFIAHETSSLFQAGNVVLVGTQGSGKSMLLSLLKPETRVAYVKAEEPFPIGPTEGGRYIGAGVNITRSGAVDFGQRPIAGKEDPEAAAAYFADFLNYWIVKDLLLTLQTLIDCPAAATDAGVTTHARDGLDDFASALAEQDCWFGALAGVSSFGDLTDRLRERIAGYRNFFNYNSDALDPAIDRHKTSAGEPISVAASLLRSLGIIGDDVNLFVRIDQYEELGRLDEWQELEYADTFAAVIHKMLGLRDPRVSYRIGTRRHAWPDNPRMQGTSAVLEELRNFKIVDLDDILMPAEHRRRFPRFAEDVFKRRLDWAGYRTGSETSGVVRAVFGPSPRPPERANLYVSSHTYVPSGAPDWPPAVRQLLKRIAEESPLDSVLAEAYISQKGAEQVEAATPEDAPWVRRQWWRKERTGQALLQLAARQRQRMIWCGAEDVLALSGANILVFVSLCQSIWDAYLRNDESTRLLTSLPNIRDPYVQDEGIYQASRYWHRKIRADPDGDSRLRFVNHVGGLFREWLRLDLKMSYPGYNGFSLDGAELRRDKEVREFLNQAAAYGVLVDREHSTRNRGGSRRHKWYLAPIYSPYFQIPASHTKEPNYVTTSELRKWLAEAEVPGFISRAEERMSPHASQESLFSGGESD